MLTRFFWKKWSARKWFGKGEFVNVSNNLKLLPLNIVDRFSETIKIIIVSLNEKGKDAAHQNWVVH